MRSDPSVYLNCATSETLPLPDGSFANLHHFDDLLDGSIEVVDPGSHQQS